MNREFIENRLRAQFERNLSERLEKNEAEARDAFEADLPELVNEEAIEDAA